MLNCIDWLAPILSEDIGSGDFVGAVVALNLASEFWGPLNSRLKWLHDAPLRRLKELENRITTADEEIDDKKVSSAIYSILHHLPPIVSFVHEVVWLTFRSLAVIAAMIGFLILYAGQWSVYNILLAFPIALYLLVTLISVIFTQLYEWVITGLVRGIWGIHTKLANSGAKAEKQILKAQERGVAKQTCKVSAKPQQLDSIRLPFGKNKNCGVKEVDDLDYLKWLLSNTGQRLRKVDGLEEAVKNRIDELQSR